MFHLLSTALSNSHVIKTVFQECVYCDGPHREVMRTDWSLVVIKMDWSLAVLIYNPLNITLHSVSNDQHYTSYP